MPVLDTRPDHVRDAGERGGADHPRRELKQGLQQRYHRFNYRGAVTLQAARPSRGRLWL